MTSPIERAQRWEGLGYHPAPLAPLSKVASYGFPMIDHFTRRVPVSEHARWYRPNSNVALVTGDLLVVDIDRKEAAREIYRRLRPLLKTCVETRKGVHMYFQSPSPDFPTGKLEDGDLKASGGYVVGEGSTVFDKDSRERWTYRFVEGHGPVPFGDLPVYEPGMVPARVTGMRALRRGEVKNALAYAMRVQSLDDGTSMSRDRALVRFFAILRDGGLTEAQAMAAAVQWNQGGNAVPPWSLDQLARACSNTFAKEVPR